MVHLTVGPHVQNLGLSNIEHNSRVGDHEILFFSFWEEMILEKRDSDFFFCRAEKSGMNMMH